MLCSRKMQTGSPNAVSPPEHPPGARGATNDDGADDDTTKSLDNEFA